MHGAPPVPRAVASNLPLDRDTFSPAYGVDTYINHDNNMINSQ